MTYVQRTIFPYDCPTSCGLLAETDGKKILRVKGDKTHPANGKKQEMRSQSVF